MNESVFVFGWFLLALAVGRAAQNKGRSFAMFFIASLLFSPLIAGILLLVGGNGSSSTCPFCGKGTPKTAALCGSCRTPLPVVKLRPYYAAVLQDRPELGKPESRQALDDLVNATVARMEAKGHKIK